MATEFCGTSVTIPTGMSGEFDVIDKYEKLMEATIAEGSLYMRTKETFYELFKDLDLDSEEKARMVSESMAQLAGSMSGASMQTALAWAKEERDGESTCYSSWSSTQGSSRCTIESSSYM